MSENKKATYILGSEEQLKWKQDYFLIQEEQVS